MTIQSHYRWALFWICFGVILPLQAHSALSQQPPDTAVLDAARFSGQPVDPTAAGNHRLLAEDLVRRKHWDELLELGRGMAAKNQRDPTAFYWQGIAYFQMHKPIYAVQAFRKAEKGGMGSSVLHEDLGLAYYDLNQFKLFEAEMKIASRQAPSDYAPSYYLGIYYLSIQSDPAKALTYFREAVALNPSDWKSLYQLGYCLELDGDLANARESYLKSIDFAHKNDQPFGWPYQGIARLDENTNLNEALHYAKKAVEVEPNEAAHHLMLAKLYERAGDFPDGLKEARIAASQDPNRAVIRYLLFRLYRKIGDAASAETELRMFQTLNAAYGPE